MTKVMLVCLLAVITGLKGATIIVAPSGGDYTSIKDAVTAQNPGDTVLVRAGTYDETFVFSKTTGSAANRFTVAAYGDEKVIIPRGLRVIGDYYTIRGFTCTIGGLNFLNGAEHNRVEDCFFDRVGGTGIVFNGGSSNNTASHCTVFRPDVIGCMLTGYGNTLEYSVIEGPTGQDGRSDSDGIRVNGSDHCTLRGCHVFHIWRVGSSHADVLQNWLGFRHLTIEDNILGSWDLQGGSIRDPSNAHFQMAMEDAGTYDVDTVIFRRNIFLGGGPRSLNVWDNQGSNSRRFRNVSIYNNLFYTRGYAELEYMINLKVKNNIFYTRYDINEHVGYRLRYNQNEEVDYNCFYPESKTEAHSLNQNPLLVNDDRFSGNYHLRSTSPCIDAGVDVGLTQDRDGNPIKGAPDMGPYEYTVNKLEDLRPGSRRYGAGPKPVFYWGNTDLWQGELVVFDLQGRQVRKGTDPSTGIYIASSPDYILHKVILVK